MCDATASHNGRLPLPKSVLSCPLFWVQEIDRIFCRLQTPVRGYEAIVVVAVARANRVVALTCCKQILFHHFRPPFLVRDGDALCSWCLGSSVPDSRAEGLRYIRPERDTVGSGKIYRHVGGPFHLLWDRFNLSSNKFHRTESGAVRIRPLTCACVCFWRRWHSFVSNDKSFRGLGKCYGLGFGNNDGKVVIELKRYHRENTTEKSKSLKDKTGPEDILLTYEEKKISLLFLK